jgi:hypothetical protein
VGVRISLGAFTPCLQGFLRALAWLPQADPAHALAHKEFVLSAVSRFAMR